MRRHGPEPVWLRAWDCGRIGDGSSWVWFRVGAAGDRGGVLARCYGLAMSPSTTCGLMAPAAVRRPTATVGEDRSVCSTTQ